MNTCKNSQKPRINYDILRKGGRHTDHKDRKRERQQSKREVKNETSKFREDNGKM